MRYRQAKKLRRGDEVIMKRMQLPLRVVAVRWDAKIVTLELVDEFNSSIELNHLEVQ
jgi:hypothetical protein